MLKIPAVFADHAVFQHSAELTVYGSTAPGTTVRASLCSEEKCIFRQSVYADESGKFALTMPTPEASFSPYRFEISDGTETLTFTDWLFGELWLAAGQSNMELAVGQMSDENRFRKFAGNKVMRFFYQEFGDLSLLPEEPEMTVGGTWCTVEEETFKKISACGFCAAAEMYEFLNKNDKQVPVGLIHSNMGATFIECWLPQKETEQDEEMMAYMLKPHRFFPFGKGWNAYGGENYRQPYGLFNRKISALSGLQLRGILWYQGENNVGNRESAAHYRHALKLYQRVYESMFLMKGQKHLPVICIQIYAFFSDFMYPDGAETECRVGYLNEAFIEAFKDEPDKFSVVPSYDLPALFAPYSHKVYPHPVHPMHKFELGCRMGRVAAAKVYGKEGLSSAPFYKNSEILGNKIRLTFETWGYMLKQSEEGLTGFYICGKNKIYVEAHAEIVGSNQVELSSPVIREPCFAAYRYDDMAMGPGLYCDDMPVASFSTDREGEVCIAPKPWLFTDRNSCVVQTEINDDVPRMDFFPRPLWHSLYDSELCTDNINCRTKAALRIRGNGPYIGACVKRYPCGYPLDLQNYSAFRFAVFHFEGAKLTVAVQEASGAKKLPVHILPLTSESEDEYGWTVFEADLQAVKIENAERLSFIFDVTGKKLPAVNIDDLVLIPKE